MAYIHDLEMRAETAREAMAGLLELMSAAKGDVGVRPMCALVELVFNAADAAMPKNRRDPDNDDPTWAP